MFGKGLFILFIILLAWIMISLLRGGGTGSFLVGVFTGASIIKIYAAKFTKKEEPKEIPQKMMIDDSVLQLAEILRSNIHDNQVS